MLPGKYSHWLPINAVQTPTPCCASCWIEWTSNQQSAQKITLTSVKRERLTRIVWFGPEASLSLSDNNPLNDSTWTITWGKVSSVPWFSPEGFSWVRSAKHSAPDSLQQIYPETWSLKRATLCWGTFFGKTTLWHHLFLPFLLASNHLSMHLGSVPLIFLLP